MPIRRATILSLLLIAFMAAAVQAGVPQLLNYQGRLEDSFGDPVADGNYSITFAIHDAATGGALQWSETQANVAVADGFFNTLLGTVTPLNDSVFSGEERFLEITVGTQTLAPRTQLASVGYAHRISTIDGAKSGEITGDLTIYADDSAFIMPPGSRATPDLIRFAFGAEGGSMAIYEPADSKGGDNTPVKKVEVRSDGLTLFGATEDDTTLQVYQNGDIVGVGQLTMGENSSSGEETTVLGFENDAAGDSSTIGGGSNNTTTGTSSVIAGGYNNMVSGEGGVISGGSTNDVSGAYSNIGGGFENEVSGDYSVVPGGQSNEVEGHHAMASGYRSKSLHDGSYVWADFSEEDFMSTSEDQFLIRANGGVGIGTNSPKGVFDVEGPDGDLTVNLPNASIGGAEILDEPGMAADRTAGEIELVADTANMETILSVEIEIPAAGYVFLLGGGTLRSQGTFLRNQAYLQIDETAGGSLEEGYAVIAGNGDYVPPNRPHFFNLTTQRVFFKTAGVYTFYLEGTGHPDNGGSAITAIRNPYLTALFFPTSYGTVGTLFSGDEFILLDPTPSSTPVESISAIDGSTESYYQVDLRELELNAATARAAAAEAEKALLEARLRAAGGN